MPKYDIRTNPVTIHMPIVDVQEEETKKTGRPSEIAESKENQDPALAPLPSMRSLGSFNYSFFSKTKNLIQESTQLSLKISETILEYAPGIGELSLIIQSEIERIESEMEQHPLSKIEGSKYKPQRRLPYHVMDIFFIKLSEFLALYISPNSSETELKAILFGLHDNPSEDIPPAVLEIARYAYFLNHHNNPSDLPIFAWFQVQIFALKFHLETSFKDPAVVGLFASYFNKVLPMLPYLFDVPEELEACGPVSTLGSYWYNNFLIANYKENLWRNVEMNECEPKDYKQLISQLLEYTSDPFKQFAILDDVWCGRPSEVPIHEFFEFIASLARKGINAAAALIVTTHQRGFPLLCDGKLSERCSTLTPNDFFQWILDATNLDCEVISSCLPGFIREFLHYLLQNDDDDFIIQVLCNLQFDQKKLNVQKITVAMTILSEVNTIRPDLNSQLVPLRTSLSSVITHLRADNTLNPIYRNSKTSASDLQALLEMDTAENTSTVSI